MRKKIVGEDKGQDILVRVPSDLRTINANLREINKVLEAKFKAVLSENAAMILRLGKLEREYETRRMKLSASKLAASATRTKLLGHIS